MAPPVLFRQYACWRSSDPEVTTLTTSPFRYTRAIASTESHYPYYFTFQAYKNNSVCLIIITFCRHCARKSRNTGLHLSSSVSIGAGSLLILKMTRRGWTAHRGGVISAISMALMPIAQTSACGSICFSGCPSQEIVASTSHKSSFLSPCWPHFAI
jgi:hypothetical protein